MRIVATLLLLALAALPTRAQSSPTIRPKYASDCQLIESGESIDAKTREVTTYYRVVCTLKYIDDKKTRLVWEGQLVLPTNATEYDATQAICRWLLEGKPALVLADRKGRVK